MKRSLSHGLVTALIALGLTMTSGPAMARGGSGGGGGRAGGFGGFGGRSGVGGRAGGDAGGAGAIAEARSGAGQLARPGPGRPGDGRPGDGHGGGHHHGGGHDHFPPFWYPFYGGSAFGLGLGFYDPFYDPFYDDGYYRDRDRDELKGQKENVAVEVSPKDAEIFANGVSYGKRKAKFNLPAGEWLVELRAPGYETQVVKLNVEPGVKYRVERKLHKGELDIDRDR